MSHNTNSTCEVLLDAWLGLTSTLWNTRLVSTLTFNETHVMGLLLRMSTQDAPMTATDLIRHTRMLKSQMNKILTSLEKRGYLTRTRSSQDKRQIHVLLTKEGRQAYLSEHENVLGIMNRLIHELGEERALAVAGELNTITGILDNVVPENK